MFSNRIWKTAWKSSKNLKFFSFSTQNRVLLMSKILLKAFLTIRWYYMMFETGFNISLFAPLYFRYHGQRPIKKMIFTLKIWFVITTTSTSALIFKLKKIQFFCIRQTWGAFTPSTRCVMVIILLHRLNIE